MQIGVVFPQTELGADAGAVRTYAERVEQLGYAHILVYDHVVGADPAVHQGWQGPYDVHTTFHEPMVLFGYLAALTSSWLARSTDCRIPPASTRSSMRKGLLRLDLN